MSAFSNNSSGANSSGQQIGASTAASVLASAEAILAQNDHPIELLPELGDDAGWSEIKVSYALSLPQILALKKMIKTQQASPGKGSTAILCACKHTCSKHTWCEHTRSCKHTRRHTWCQHSHSQRRKRCEHTHNDDCTHTQHQESGETVARQAGTHTVDGLQHAA
jgi:hypothetical protein